ncbi:DDE_Tnp_IS1595 domain-containing protein [Nephila pilipes]|uniref:DDE_Tnp_IS1595 domain-containing protein n=1 Tax=Nephila pilipes TaxID=299642 RepID=A0A8X6NZS7_NEPPI|nr:DDE_Tnp_IS1595 domain-containing protein [Nephila pilipes]
MKFAAKNSLSDGYSWICRKSTNNKVCGATKTIRHGSWFTCSKLRLGEIFMLTFEIILGSATSEIGQTYSFSSATLADWRQFINEVILDYVENNSEKIGGAGLLLLEMNSVNSIPMTQLVKDYQQIVWPNASVPRAYCICRKDGDLMGEAGVAKIIFVYKFCKTPDLLEEFLRKVAEFLFRTSSEKKKNDAFNTFLELVRELDWTNFTYAD